MLRALRSDATSGERKGRGPRREGTSNRVAVGENIAVHVRQHRYHWCRRHEVHLLHQDPCARVVTQGAGELVMEDRAPLVVTRFDAGRSDHHVARMRERDGTTAKHLNGEKQSERNAFQCDLLKRLQILARRPGAPRAPRA